VYCSSLLPQYLYPFFPKRGVRVISFDLCFELRKDIILFYIRLAVMSGHAGQSEAGMRLMTLERRMRDSASAFPAVFSIYVCRLICRCLLASFTTLPYRQCPL
jgi:hypothetical protein